MISATAGQMRSGSERKRAARDVEVPVLSAAELMARPALRLTRVADLLEMSYSKLIALIRAGRGPRVFRIRVRASDQSGPLYVLPATLDEWLHEREQADQETGLSDDDTPE